VKKETYTKEDMEDYALYKSGLSSNNEFKKLSKILKLMIKEYGKILSKIHNQP
jgi:hypothetical protein